MKRNLKIVTMLIILGTIIFPAILMSQENLEVKKEVLVVYPFEDKTSYNIGLTITDKIINTLSSLGRFRVVDRSKLEEILKEHELAMSGVVDQNGAAQIGQLLGAQKLVTGSVSKCVLTPKKRKKQKEKKVKVLGVDIAGVTEEVEEVYGYRCRIEVFVKFIDIQTSEIVDTITIAGKSDVNEPSKDLAIQKAIDNLITGFPEKVREAFKLKFKIVNVIDDTVYLPGGRNWGIKKGYRFKVYTLGEPIRDYQGNILEIPKKKVGMLKVDEVLDKVAKAEILYGEVKPGYIAEEWVVKNITSYFYFVLKPFKLLKNVSTYTVTDPSPEWYTTQDQEDIINIEIENDINYQYTLGLGWETEKMDPFLFGFYLEGGFGGGFWNLELGLKCALKLRMLGNFINFHLGGGGGLIFFTGTVGTVPSQSDYLHSTSGDTIEPGSDLRTTGISLGGFPEASLQLNFSDRIGLRFISGYRFFLSKENWDLQAKNTDGEWVDVIKDFNKLGTLTLSDPYFSVALTMFF